MAKLTNENRFTIRNLAIADKFDPLTQDLWAIERALAEEIRQDAYGPILKELEPLAEKYPEWFRFSNYICIRNGYSGNFHFGKSVITPGYNGYSVDTSNRALIDKTRAHKDNEKDVRQQREQAEKKLDAMLSQFGTTKQLREGWPEGKPYWVQVIGIEDKANTLPAIRTEEVNAIFGLPKEEV